jgi:hypothetical protein
VITLVTALGKDIGKMNGKLITIFLGIVPILAGAKNRLMRKAIVIGGAPTR